MYSWNAWNIAVLMVNFALMYVESLQESMHGTEISLEFPYTWYIIPP